MVHVSNAEGHRKMLAFEPNSSTQQTSPESNGTNINLSHILINTISKRFGPPPEEPGNSVVFKNNQNTFIALPTYKSKSLNLSCIVEEEPPPGMMNSNIRDNGSTEADPNANLSFLSDPNLNTNSSSQFTGTVITTTTRIGGENNVITTTEIVSKSSKKRSVESPAFSPEKLSHEVRTQNESSSPLLSTTVAAGVNTEIENPKSPNRDKVEFKTKGYKESPESPSSLPNAGNANDDDGGSNCRSIPVPESSTPANAADRIGESCTESPPHSAVSQKHGKAMNGSKNVCLKRVSFGSSKGSMVETLIYESPNSEERREIVKTITNSDGSSKVLTLTGGQDNADSMNSPTGASSAGSTGGSRPPSRVRVTFYESEKPLAVSSPESDTIDFDISNMTHPASPNAESTPINYSRHLSVESGWDNPFRPDGDLSKEADQIVELIKEGKPINDETLRSISPSVMHSINYTNNLTASPQQGKNGSANGTEIGHGIVVPPNQTGVVEHVTLKKKKGCCVIQ